MPSSREAICAVEAPSGAANFAGDVHQMVREAARVARGGDAIHRVALGDPGEVAANVRALLPQRSRVGVDRHEAMADTLAQGRDLRGRGLGRRPVAGAEAPGRDQRIDRDVEGAVRRLAHRRRDAEYLEGRRGHREGNARLGAVEARELRVGPIGRHERVHLAEPRLDLASDRAALRVRERIRDRDRPGRPQRLAGEDGLALGDVRADEPVHRQRDQRDEDDREREPRARRERAGGTLRRLSRSHRRGCSPAPLRGPSASGSRRRSSSAGRRCSTRNPRAPGGPSGSCRTGPGG